MSKTAKVILTTLLVIFLFVTIVIATMPHSVAIMISPFMPIVSVIFCIIYAIFIMVGFWYALWCLLWEL